MHRGLTLALVVLLGGGFALLALIVMILGGLGATGGAYAGDAPPTPQPPARISAAALPRQRITLGSGVSFEMVLVPAGEFEMGSPMGQVPQGTDVVGEPDPADLYGRSTQSWRAEDEVLHRVRITKPFWLATTELTRAAWETVMGSDCASGAGERALPATGVSWEDGQSYLRRINAQVAGGGFRLPTEAEWEYACRATSTTLFCMGDRLDSLPKHAWYVRNSAGTAHAVGTLEPNAWGLHDMHGNVYEWCEDEYAPYAIAGPDGVRDPVGLAGSGLRVARGGGFSCPASHLRSAMRLKLPPTVRDAWKGLRLARTVLEAPPCPQTPAGAPRPEPPAPAPSPPAPGPGAPPPAPAPKPAGGPSEPDASPEKGNGVPSWAHVAPAQIDAAKRAGVPVAFENAIGMRFVLIPGGTFTMGSPPSEQDRDETETQHEVTLTKPYYLQTTEVTNGQYRRFKADHQSQEQQAGHSLDGDEQPVGQVSWNEAVAFTGWLNREHPGRGYRLPTEAEWERACRAGTSTPFWWGSSITTDQANYDGGSIYGGGRRGTLRHATVPVGSLPVSPWGLYEVHGNVREWVSDRYDDQDYPEGPATDPTGPVEDAARNGSRTVRGGAYEESAHMIRAAFRIGLQGDDEVRSYIGFRVAATVGGK